MRLSREVITQSESKSSIAKQPLIMVHSGSHRKVSSSPAQTKSGTVTVRQISKSLFPFLDKAVVCLYS